MTDNILAKLFEHNNWANRQIIQACAVLSAAQLDAQPQTATKGTIRQTLTHMVRAQQGYLALLTLPLDARPPRPDSYPSFAALQEAADLGGEGLLALARGPATQVLHTRLQTGDGYSVEPWVVMLQAINHATEHREQIKSMLSAFDITPPSIDGWDYGEFTSAVTPIA